MATMTAAAAAAVGSALLVLATMTAPTASRSLMSSAKRGQRLTTTPEVCSHQARNASGLCRPLTSCPSAVRELRKNMYPQLCGFAGSSLVPEVCCTDTEQQLVDNRVMAGGGGHNQASSLSGGASGASSGGAPDDQPMSCKQYLHAQEAAAHLHRPGNAGRERRPGALARKKCREFVQYVCYETASPALMLGGTDVYDRCHYRVELISGGKEVEPMEFPHMVLLGYGDRNAIDFACGGSLISPEYVLTAAHCLTNRHHGEIRQIRWALLGALDRTVTPHANARPQLISIVDVIAHPDYRSNLRYHDIALLRLARPAEMSDHVRPACLHTDLDGDPSGLTAIATGWGATGDAEDLSNRLLKVNLPILNNERCRRIMNSKADHKLNRGIVESQMCAGGGKGVEAVRDTCPGDSGGPLQVATNSDPYCMYRVVGLVSFGPACGIGLPGVYTRVASYASWIENVVWPEDDE